MSEKHLKIAKNLQRLALKKFRMINPEKLSTSEVLKILSVGINLERALGAQSGDDGASFVKNFIQKNLEE